MKKVINKPEDLVIEMCEGMIKAHPTQLAFNRKFKIISRAKVNKQKVILFRLRQFKTFLAVNGYINGIAFAGENSATSFSYTLFIVNN